MAQPFNNMDIKLYKFKKRTNSTKQPSPDSANTFACTVNEDCSINNPVVRINAPDTLIDLVTKTISNQSIVHITDGVSGQPCPSVVANIDYNSQGVTGATVTRCGKNLVTECFYYNTNSYVTTPVFLPIGTYTISFESTEISTIHIRKKTTVDISGASYATKYNTNSFTFSADEATFYLFQFYRSSGWTDAPEHAQCEVGSLATAYEAYSGTTYTADFERTIYGGNYDFVSGILTEDTDSNGDPISPPNVYNLTGQTITTAQGANNFYCDTGDILTFTYKAYEQSSNMKIYDLNYAYIPDWKRYYFVSQVIFELGTWVFVLRCDVMASKKYDIGESEHYIERCSYEFDGDIIDGLYPEKTDPELVIAEPDEVAPGVLPCIFGDSTTPGITPSYIVGIIGGIAQENIGAVGDCYNGSVVYFAMAQDQLGDFVASLLNSVNLYAIDPNEISYDLQKQLINPIQYIESIKCVPFMPSATSNYVAKQYYLGFQYMDVPYAYGTVDPKTSTNRSWNICKAPVIGSTTNYDNGYMEFKQNMLKMPLHPEMDSRGHWVLSSPISKYVFTCEPFGQIEIPSGNIMHAPITTPQSGDPYIGLWYSICFDISTGDCTLFLSWDADITHAFIKQTRNCCIPVPVHQSVQDVMTFRQDMRALGFQAIEGAFGLVKSSVDAVGGTSEVSDSRTLTASKTEYDIGGPIGSAINTMDKMMKTIDDATIANQVKISGNSANGSYMSFNKDLCTPRVFCYFTPLAEEHNEERGKPLCAVRKIKDIPGYILCSGAEIETYGTAEENNAIASFLNGGFYYE